MRKIVHKLFWAWEFEKEEAWLNEMAAEGMALVGVGWCRYEFEPCEPGEYTFRIQLLEKVPTDAESAEYLAFLEETGVAHVGTWMRWVYLRRKTSEGPFELFSDNASRARHLGLVLAFLGIIGGLNLYVGGYNMIIWAVNGLGLHLLSIINLLLGVLSFVGFARLKKKQNALKKDQSLFE